MLKTKTPNFQFEARICCTHHLDDLWSWNILLFKPKAILSIHNVGSSEKFSNQVKARKSAKEFCDTFSWKIIRG